MAERRQVLVADDEPNLRRVLSAQLQRDGYDVHVVADGEEAIQALAEHHIDVVISDLRMPKVDGMALLKSIGETHPEIPVIMITAHGTVDTAVEALKLGAFDYVTKPFEQAEFRNVVAKAARTSELSLASAGPMGSRGRFGLIGESDAMKDVYNVIDKVADTPSTVLVTGESGTGKELVARALHENGSRAKKPFIRVNCAAIPKDLIESELFGYEKGAFTGAVTSKPGRFELAHEGTLFLDEIGEIPISMQVKLLRALQESEFERVGGIKTIRVDVRLIAATNRDLRSAIDTGEFREDLFYRLNVVHMRLPALRERVGDIPLLLNHFVARFGERLGRKVNGFSEPALKLMLAYPFRGNIRELENVVERCMLFCDEDKIQISHLPPEIRGTNPRAPSALSADVPRDVDESVGLKDAVKVATARIEKELIVHALDKNDGNVTHTARLLKISRKSLQTKMKEFGLRE